VVETTLFNENCVPFVYPFRDIASYLSKVADVHLPHLHLEPALGMTQFKLLHPTLRRFNRTPTCDRQTRTQTRERQPIGPRRNQRSRGKIFLHFDKLRQYSAIISRLLFTQSGCQKTCRLTLSVILNIILQQWMPRHYSFRTTNSILFLWKTTSRLFIMRQKVVITFVVSWRLAPYFEIELLMLVNRCFFKNTNKIFLLALPA